MEGPPSEGRGSDSLWRARVGQPGSALSDAQLSPSLQKLWCRQYVHTYTYTHGRCIPSRALRSPSQPLSQTSAAGEVKTPSRIKEEKQQEDGGRDGGMGEKRREKVYLHVRWRCLPRRQFPTRLSLGRWGEEIGELGTASRSERAELRSLSGERWE